MRRSSSRSASFVLALVLLPSTVAAAPITTLFNTGVDNAGVLLVGGAGTVDLHWDIIAGPGIAAPIDAVTYFNGAYAADGPSSRWLSANAVGGNGAGTYLFRTTFNLTGFDPALTTITASCGTDNLLTVVHLNGVGVGGDCDGFNPFPSGSFAINAGFVGGVNTLDFEVVDQGFPMAFRAQFTSDTQPLQNGPGPTPVPEPATLALLAGAAALFARRRA